MVVLREPGKGGTLGRWWLVSGGTALGRVSEALMGPQLVPTESSGDPEFLWLSVSASDHSLPHVCVVMWPRPLTEAYPQNHLTLTLSLQNCELYKPLLCNALSTLL